MASERPSESVTTRSARPLVLALAGFVVLGVVLGGIGIWRGSSADADQGGSSTDRNQLIARANDFAVAMNTFDYSKPEDYRKRVKTLLTADYYQDFLKNSEATATVLKQNKITLKSGDANVVGAAIESLDKDSAEVLVAVDASISSERAAATTPRKFRWKIVFAKSKGKWLVTRFESIGTGEATVAPDPATTPSAAPTPSAGTEKGGDK